MMKNVILITGAGQRIGLYLAKSFLKRQDKVFFTYKTNRPEVDILKAQGAIGFKVDFTKKEQVEDFLVSINTQVESVKLLIHNASIWVKDECVNTSLFNDMVAVHQIVPYQITMGLEHKLKAYKNTANIIAISDSKIKGGHQDFAAYLSTKSALKTLMDSFAKKFAPHIKVNTIASGLVIFNKDDTSDYKAKRLRAMAIPIEPKEQTILNAIDFLVNSPNSTGSTIELGQLSSRI